ncbi:MAG TPA: hypothetical protein VJ937_02610 [Salinivirga sp.]|uniref:hypothetical protein n=1 Tax=Salinivirga sp. TaxID=1970192 RepID=UPI002B47D314|nr:hypothetical protein [Salinivirga sp.]HKK58346.1 hypothetical protein [Salinivirga sp.]
MDTQKLAMQQKVMECMEENMKGWSHILEMQKDYDRFVKNMKKIQELQPAVHNDTEPIAVNIKNTREKLIAQLLPVLKVLSVYAHDKKMKKLEQKTKTDRKALNKLSAGKLEKEALTIWKAINKHQNTNVEEKKSTEPEKYGLSQKMIDSLYETIVQYKNLRQNYKEERKAQKKAIESTQDLIRANNKLLKNRIDKFIFLFEQSQPDFFNAYAMARKNKPMPAKPPKKSSNGQTKNKQTKKTTDKK